MKKVEYTKEITDFIETYDNASYKIWNSTSGEIVKIRKYIRDHYLKEQNFCCAYCRIEKKESHGMTWDIEHILSKSEFPEFLFEPENLAVACKECNTPKDNHNILVALGKPKEFPRDKFEYTIIHPHFDIYSEHFEIIIIKGKRSYRLLNNQKARSTYIFCNLSRFDYQYAEWDAFDQAIVSEFSNFLDRCPPNATPTEIKRMLGHMRFSHNCDF